MALSMCFPQFPQAKSLEKTQAKKSLTVNPLSFGHLPSWASLNVKQASSQTHKNHGGGGNVENVHLISLSKQGKFQEAQAFLHSMESSNIPVMPQTYVTLFEACGDMGSLSFGKIFHERMKRVEKEPEIFLGNHLLSMYSKLGSIVDAFQVFNEMPSKNSVTWSIMVSAFSQNGFVSEALSLLSDMNVIGISSNQSVYVSLLRACSNSPRGPEPGKQLHSQIIKLGFIPDLLIETALCNMYIKCRELDSAKLIFDNMPEKNAVTWTAVMSGYTQAGKEEAALALYQKILMVGNEPDGFVFSVILKACAGLNNLKFGKLVHAHILKLGMEKEVSVGTPLVDMYFKCGMVEYGRQVFKRISQPNEVSWSVIIAGYAQVGDVEESLGLFNLLRRSGGPMNSFIYSSVFQACAVLADLNLGTQLHGDGIKMGLISDLYGESSLVTMYSRCGCFENSCRVFESIEDPDIVAWTAMIAGCAYHGHASKALQLFERMKLLGVRPNTITFVGLLTACSHAGFVSKAWNYLDSMRKDYGVKPTIDHYDCMVDVYCRAGLLDDAFHLIKEMPFEPEAMTWRILLGGCSAHGNVRLGKIAGAGLLELEPDDNAAYVLLFNLHASAGLWEEAAKIRKMMSERGVRKELGCSWVVIKDKVHRFIVGDRHHPLTQKIYSKLEELKIALGKSGYICQKTHKIQDLKEERNNQLLDHSEKLAIAYGLVSTPNNAPIYVFKNIRVCSDCHIFIKLTSCFVGREIVIRDSSRFHHFKGGQCSCKDYW
ncbi:pentatricopeptide repeat-containing protein At5g13270, chloroplastic [Amborella trichopoda]|uniref:pentatricopeptide repeat-containing protein At5g13270, chloroplastic n=1 Tax=Amborella trichopoda TaxID=13333 RepID=UPI0005D3F9F5|nr:pentatricopeptide repeat-containing protein At5g13270, chloroplastic [Amborella trichopoda]|eukprot:XP_011623525.1 pentatricopeptide repeat-containing protein At5g13270, chloroplastic [Amborella trichopoda]